MWQPGYLESLAPLPGALSKMGATACLERVSLVKEGVKERDLSYAETLVHFVSFSLDFLDRIGFFLLLADLPKLAEVLRAAQAWPWPWAGARVAEHTQRSLAPLFKLLSSLAPNKVHDTLGHLRTLLDDWDGNDSLERLSRIQQALELVQPRRVQSCLAELSDLLEQQDSHLAWLARHPFTGEELGPPNLFFTLRWARETLRSVLTMHGNCLLTSLQQALEGLGEIQAVGPRPGDLQH